MSDTITKFEEIGGETKSYSGLGLWMQTNTNEILENHIETKVPYNNTQYQIFRELLEIFRDWEESWKYYSNNSNIIKKPKNADKLIEELTSQYEIKVKKGL